MRHFKLLGVALVALFAYGVMVTGASAQTVLPDISIALEGSTYPLHLEVTYLTSSFLENTGSEGLESKKEKGGSVLLLLLANELTSLGTFSVLFTKVHFLKEGKEEEECNTVGDPTGEILAGGTFHVVWLPPANSRARGVLFLEREIMIECNKGKVKVKVKGLALSSLTEPVSTEDTTLAYGVLHKGSTKGHPELSKYLTDTGNEAEAKLESNFGTGFVVSAENVEEGADLHALGGNMFEITPVEE